MKPLTDFPIPDRLAQRPRHKGIPIPFTTMLLPDGSPDFRVTDHERWLNCVDDDLCALCGEDLPPLNWYIGGDKCVDSKMFFDPAMCLECAIYALVVCPFLAMKKGYAAEGKAEERFNASGAEGEVRTSQTVSTAVPKQFFLFAATHMALVKIAQTGDVTIMLPPDAVQAIIPVPNRREGRHFAEFIAGLGGVRDSLMKHVAVQLMVRCPHCQRKTPVDESKGGSAVQVCQSCGNWYKFEEGGS